MVRGSTLVLLAIGVGCSEPAVAPKPDPPAPVQFAEPSPTPTPPSPTPTPTPTDPVPVVPSSNPSVQCAASEGELVHRCEALRSLLSEGEELSRSARIVPHHHDGKFAGIKLFGIRRGTVPAALGLANGDLLLGVGDQDFDSTEAMLQAWTALGVESAPPMVELRWQRKGVDRRTMVVWVDRFD